MVNMKNLSLVLLAVQNCSQMLMMRFAVTHQPYIKSTAVVMQECIKLCISLVFCVVIDGNSPAQVAKIIQTMFTERASETAKMAVPGILYAIQNNLLYVAMTNLEGPTCSVLYQLKILTTAIFSVTVLRRSISQQKWLSLVVLFCGAASVQWASAHSNQAVPTGHHHIVVGDPFIGLVAVLSACCISGFAGVFLEMKLKDMRASLWVKNVQLASFGIVFGLAGSLYKDGAAISEGGFFQGYSPVVWLVILDVSAGGLLVALVVKYADSIRKGFATTVSILISTVISMIFLQFHLSSYFIVGLVLVVIATFGYIQPEPPSTTSPDKSPA